MAPPGAAASPETSPSADGWRFSLAPLAEPAALARDWRVLEARGDAPYFLSWDWIGCWLSGLAADRRPARLTIERAGRIVGLAVVAQTTPRRLGILPHRRLHLHETGDAALDSLTIEYNGILTEPPWREEALRRAVAWLLASHADEIVISGVPAAVLQGLGKGLSVRLHDRKPTYAIDLARITAEGGEFAATLSANSRTRLRRTIREFEALGPLRIAAAQTRPEAHDMLTRMMALHQASWQERGRAGAFADPRIVAFHHRLIDDTFAAGGLQFLRCDAGSSVIGYLYNFKRNGRIYAYQSGFDYGLLPRARPGWICHYLAIEENRRAGMTTYDLLAGENQFKSSFAERATELIWLSVERQGWYPAMMQALRSAKTFCISRLLLKR